MFQKFNNSPPIGRPEAYGYYLMEWFDDVGKIWSPDRLVTELCHILNTCPQIHC